MRKEKEAYGQIELYDYLVQNNAPLKKMYDEMVNNINFSNKKNLEIGGGIGTLSDKLLKNNSNLIIFEKEKIYREYLLKRDYTVVDFDIVKNNEFINTPFDLVFTSLTFHHIRPNEKELFLKNIINNLREDGCLVLGDMFIPNFDNETERKNSVAKFYNYQIDYAKKFGVPEAIDDFQISKQEDLDMDGEYKISLEKTLKMLKQVGFKKIKFEYIESEDENIDWKLFGYVIIRAYK